MVTMGVDCHPDFQKGLPLEQVAREGFGFLSVKVSEGLNNQWEFTTKTRPGAAEWIRRGQAAGLICLAYHFLRPGDVAGQARMFAGSLARCGGIPGVLDAEALATDGRTPTLTIGMIREFHATATALGARIPLLYLPSWYHQRIGNPDLRGLPPLWASSYPSSRQAPASVLYQAVTPDRWTAYGGLPVAVLQFAETGLVAGMTVDVNAYLGSKESFASLVGAPHTLNASNLVESDPVQNFRVTGTGLLPLLCPTGSASAVTASAWVSAVVDGPGAGKVKYWFQNDTAGISAPEVSISFADGHSSRVAVPVPDGTTMIRVDHQFPAGGTICLEIKPKPV